MSKELRGAVPFDEGMADMYRKNLKWQRGCSTNVLKMEMLKCCLSHSSSDRQGIWRGEPCRRNGRIE